jgi:RNA polymerase sigma-70 factor (ECF subfamily)
MSRFEDLLQRVRAGEEEAAAEFVRVYEPHVRRVVRARLRIARLRRVADSSDFCQAVMGSFLVRAAMGQYEVAGSDELRNLLGRIARNKVADLVRRPEYRVCAVPVAAPGVTGVEPIVVGGGPASRLAWNELLQAGRDRLSERERQVSELRAQGLAWGEVADRMGEKPDAVRNRLNRALKRIAGELGLEELDDD